MHYRIAGLSIAVTMLLAACGRPDSTGIYLSKTDRAVELIQLIQNKDGVVTGRTEVMTIGTGGVINDDSANLDGTASKHDLVFKPASAWLGGVSASGSFTRDALIISRNGIQLKAQKASLDDFQKASARLKAKAADERRQVAEVAAKQAAQVAQTTAIGDAANKATKLQEAAADLHADAAKLNEAVSAAPDFGQRSADNTTRIAKMAQLAPTLSSTDRSRLAVSANQVIVGTNQIDVARTQYAIGLNQIVARAEPVAEAVQQFCDTPQGAQLPEPCFQAKSAATDFQSALVHGSALFKSYKQTVQTELSRQSQLAQRIGG